MKKSLVLPVLALAGTLVANAFYLEGSVRPSRPRSLRGEIVAMTQVAQPPLPGDA